ncbi:hypothetical protein BKA70DRAFT_1437824 [Coprinopsis sp. MPI-PUGE-AT-0042]|nr:hypothetical protein BKA70DRAFT_1437824 [Coprinopsis sp. MPI-PUGE-AT-0042]
MSLLTLRRTYSFGHCISGSLLLSSATSRPATSSTSSERSELLRNAPTNRVKGEEAAWPATLKSQARSSEASPSTSPIPVDAPAERQTPRRLTLQERDEQLRQILEDRSGDGGASGLELEDGAPVAMKRGVRDNMFRYI